MFFCENDDNMLYIKIDDDGKLLYHCKLCGEEYDIDQLNKNEKTKNCVYKHNYQTKNYSYKTYINKNMFKDPNASRIKDLSVPMLIANQIQLERIRKLSILNIILLMGFLYCCTLCEKKWMIRVLNWINLSFLINHKLKQKYLIEYHL